MRRNQGYARLLRPGLHIKRWLALLFAGIVLLSLAVGYTFKNVYSVTSVTGPSQHIVHDVTLQFLPRWGRALLFGLVGIGIVGTSMVKLSQSLLGPYMRVGNSDSMLEQLYKHRMLAKGPRVVAIGGGTGLSAMLRGIKKYTGNIHAIVTVADDGGSSGRLRTEFRVLPPGDFRQCLTALAETEPLMTELFNHRFTGEGSLGGHAFGNLFIMAMAEITGNFEKALAESGRVLAVRGQIVPSTLQDVTLCATAGRDLRIGESNVPYGEEPIERVFLEPPDPPINPEAEAAILDAELVEALRATPAVKVYICNVASQVGETSGYTVSQHLDAIESHIGGNIFDYVIVNNNTSAPLPPSAVAAGVGRITFDRERSSERPIHYILADVVDSTISSHHDSDKLARIIMKRVWR